MEEFNIKIKIFKYGEELMIFPDWKISKKNNLNFNSLLKILGEPQRIKSCKCPVQKYGWHIQNNTLVITD